MELLVSRTVMATAHFPNVTSQMGNASVQLANSGLGFILSVLIVTLVASVTGVSMELDIASVQLNIMEPVVQVAAVQTVQEEPVTKMACVQLDV